jgi:hypothetical protein
VKVHDIKVGAAAPVQDLIEEAADERAAILRIPVVVGEAAEEDLGGRVDLLDGLVGGGQDVDVGLRIVAKEAKAGGVDGPRSLPLSGSL